jgi:hypothetical protein
LTRLLKPAHSSALGPSAGRWVLRQGGGRNRTAPGRALSPSETPLATTHGLIERIPHTSSYLPTENGLRAAIVLTQTHARPLSPALASTTDPTADFPNLHRALDSVRAALDDYAKRQGLAA